MGRLTAPAISSDQVFTVLFEGHKVTVYVQKKQGKTHGQMKMCSVMRNYAISEE